jgi:hypothetical protein
MKMLSDFIEIAGRDEQITLIFLFKPGNLLIAFMWLT